MRFELFEGICKKNTSFVPRLAAPNGKRCACGLDRLLKTIFLGVSDACKFFASHRVGALDPPGTVDSLAVSRYSEPPRLDEPFLALARDWDGGSMEEQSFRAAVPNALGQRPGLWVKTNFGLPLFFFLKR